MSANRHRPHLLVLPEDDHDRQLANGFVLGLSNGQVQPLREAAGWSDVRDRFVADHVDSMRQYPQRMMVLLVDFDERAARFDELRRVIPDDLKDRVFVIGVWSTPEALRQSLGDTYEQIGRKLANECIGGRQGNYGIMLSLSTTEMRFSVYVPLRRRSSLEG